jgi:hypothetical protein
MNAPVKHLGRSGQTDYGPVTMHAVCQRSDRGGRRQRWLNWQRFRVAVHTGRSASTRRIILPHLFAGPPNHALEFDFFIIFVHLERYVTRCGSAACFCTCGYNVADEPHSRPAMNPRDHTEAPDPQPEGFPLAFAMGARGGPINCARAQVPARAPQALR